MSCNNLQQSLIPVTDIMTTALISVNPRTTAFQIAKMMEHGGIGAIIVKENTIPVGVITARDFATKIVANNLPFDTPAKKIMSSPLITVDHSETVYSTVKMMNDKKIRKIIVSEKGKIVGLVASTDLVNQLTK